MTNNLCGADTTGDQPCQNPAGENGRCWIPSHNPDCDDENPGGRPSKFTDDRAQDAIEAAREGLSKAGCERAAGVGDGTLNNWLEQDLTYTNESGEERNFFRAFRRARRTGESKLVRGGLHDDEVDTSMAKFLLASSYDYKKTEQREVTGEGGGPVEIELNETVVETGYDE